MAQKEATLLLRIKQAGAEVLDRLVFTFRDLIDIAKSVASALAEPIEKYAESERAVNQLNQVLAQQGIYSDELSRKYQSLATAIQNKTLFDDEAVISAQTTLQAYTRQKEVTEELMMATANFATQMGMDLTAAASLVGKTIGSSTNALSRYGIEINASATASEKMTRVVAGLNAKFGGQAEAAARGLGGIVQLKNTWNDFLEVVGKKLAPWVILVVDGLKSIVNSASEVGTSFDGLSVIFSGIYKIGAAVAAVFEYVGKTLGTLAGVMGGIGQAMTLNFKGAANTLKTAFSQIGEDFTSTKDNYIKRLDEIDKAAEISAGKQITANQLKNQQIQSDDDMAFAAKMESLSEKSQTELETALIEEQLKADALYQQKLAEIDAQIAAETNYTERIRLELEKRKLHDAAYTAAKLAQLTARQRFIQFFASEEMSVAQSTFGQIATLTQANNKVLNGIGKAAAIAQITISTAVGMAKALEYLGPFGYPAAAAIAAAGAVQIAKVSGVELAEGGIVKARPGGVQATIGEGGQDEAVIPLDRGGMLGGNNINITVYGGLMGDKQTAHEFAIAIDRELYELKTNRESIAL